MRKKIVAAIVAVSFMPTFGHADEVSDALEAALKAYSENDITFALEEIDFARQKLLSLQANSFQHFLPEAPSGWAREVDAEMSAGLAMFGGGVGASAEYLPEAGGPGYSVTIMADNPMVVSMGAMVTNAAMMGMQLERVGRQRVAVGEGQALALVDNRILINIEGDDPEKLLAAMRQIDFEGLQDFGR